MLRTIWIFNFGSEVFYHHRWCAVGQGQSALGVSAKVWGSPVLCHAADLPMSPQLATLPLPDDDDPPPLPERTPESFIVADQSGKWV